VFADFTTHGELRAVERLSLSLSEVIHLLNQGLCVNIGKEKSSNKMHRLFYSKFDNLCFVAVQDEINGDIMTILPIDYHENIAWKISIDAQHLARNIALGEMDSKVVDPTIQYKKSNDIVQNNTRKKGSSTAFRFKGFFWSYGSIYKTKNLGTYLANDYNFNVDLLLKDKRVIKSLRNKIKSLSSNGLCLESLYVQLGKNGDKIICNTDWNTT